MSAVRSRVHHGVAQWRIKNPKLDCFLIQHYSDHAPLRTAPHKAKITGGGRARRPWLWIHDVDVGQRAAPRRWILWWWAGESYSTVGARSFPRRRCHVSLATGQSRRSTNFLLLTVYAVQSSREIRSSQPRLDPYIPLCVCLSCKYLHPQTSQWRGSYTSTSLSARRCVNHIERRAGGPW